MNLYERVTILNDDPEHNMLGTVVGTANYMVDDRDFTTLDSPGTMRSCFVVKLDYSDQGWLHVTDVDSYGSERGKAHIDMLMVHEDNLEPAPWYVNVYEEDRGYGGSEEGGWWYDVREPVHSQKFDNKADAEDYSDSIKNEYPEEGDRPVSSVVYSGGAHTIRIENHPPMAQPQTTPHYE
jgi:hypothetical protein